MSKVYSRLFSFVTCKPISSKTSLSGPRDTTVTPRRQTKVLYIDGSEDECAIPWTSEVPVPAQENNSNWNQMVAGKSQRSERWVGYHQRVRPSIKNIEIEIRDPLLSGFGARATRWLTRSWSTYAPRTAGAPCPISCTVRRERLRCGQSQKLCCANYSLFPFPPISFPVILVSFNPPFFSPFCIFLLPCPSSHLSTFNLPTHFVFIFLEMPCV